MEYNYNRPPWLDSDIQTLFLTILTILFIVLIVKGIKKIKKR